MKILVNDYSGHPFLFELSQHLSKKYKIIHSYAQYFETPKANFNEKSQCKNLKIVPIKIKQKFKKDNFFSRRSNDVFYGKKIINLIEDQKPKIIICAQVPLDPLYEIIKYCKSNKIKTVFWMQDVYSVAISKILNKKIPLIGRLIGKYYFYLEKKCEHLSDKIIVISPGFKKFLDKESLSKTKVIENWSSFIKPKVSKIQYYKRKFNPLNKFCFIYSGTLGYKHNPELFIKIAEKFPNSIIIVSSKGKFALKLKKISQRKLLNIKVIDWIDYKHLSSFLSIADVFIVTLDSNASAFSVPSKIYAYLTLGKPILASMPFENFGSKKIKKIKVGYVSKPENIKAFLSYSEKIVKSKNLRLQLSKNSKNYSKKKHTSIQQVEKMIKTM